MTDEVRFRDDGGIRVVTLNRPHRHNAFTADGYRTLAGLLAESAADDDVRVVMLTGAGTGFCSGVDLAELAAEPEWAFRIAEWYWTRSDLNALSDRGEITAQTKRISGGTTGLSDRKALFATAKRVLARG